MWKEKVEKFRNQKVLVLGDIGLDEYVSGQVKRISPEAPVPVLDVDKEDFCLGLSGNVAQNIKSLGGEVVFVSVTGKDRVSDHIKELLEKVQVSSEYLVEDEERPTTRKLRVLTGHHHIVRIDHEKRRYLSEKVSRQVVQKVAENISECQAVILQDYSKGVLSEDVIQDVIALAKKNNIPVLVDPHRNTPLHFYRGASLIKPNFDEAVILTGYPIDSLQENKDIIGELGEKIRELTQTENIILTQGKDGMSLFEPGGKRKSFPTRARQVFDVTGAGDTVIASLALAWCALKDLEMACQIANTAAGIVVSKVGSVPCSSEELIEKLKQY